MGLGRLLIVEDDRSFAAELLRDAVRVGFDVKLANDTATARDLIETWHPAILVMDLVMPDSDGLELLRICGQLKYRGKIILMSGGFDLYLKMAEQIALAHNLNVVGKLPKPFRQNQFSYLLMSLI
jgi:DNA-binding response OmpR family regulator